VYSLSKLNSNKIKLAAIFVLIAATFVFSRLSAAAIYDADRGYGGIVQLRMGSHSVSTFQIDDMMEKRDAEGKGLKYLGWSQNGDTLCYYGDNHGIFSLIHDDGCALSEIAAYEYFGTTDGVLGETVVIDGGSYILERLFYFGDVSAIVKAGGKSGESFDALDVIPGEGEAASVSELYMNHRVTGDIVIEYSSVIKFLEALGKLALWVGVLVTAFLVLKAAFARLGAISRRAVIFCGLLLAAFACYMFIGSPVYIPDSFIPTRWSEFEFWSAAFDNYRGVAGYYFSMKTYAPDLAFRAYMLKSLAFALLAAISVIIAGIAAVKLFRERGIEIGVDNFKKYHEMLRGKSTGRS